MEERKKAKTTNANINRQTETLIDLEPAEEQAEEAKGGRDDGDYGIWRTRFGVTI
jgi:hypothetical protein